ncbi:TonB-dependent receptor [Hymenobacter seoulensis]
MLGCLPLAASVTPALAIATPARLTNTTLAPDLTVTGRVTDEKGQGLPGVNVLVKGTTNGTQTDANGAYTLSGVPDNATLVFSYVGYTAREFAVDGRTTIDVPLAPDSKIMNEVVVVGYLTQKREDVTGSVASVSSQDVRRSPVASVGEAIQGRLPGVTVANSGTPGQAPIVNIRGVGTLGSGSSPLYVIDGLWVQGGGQRDFNPQDVESVQVLKDAASLAPYGASGANGVIIITTRHGRSGAPVFTANAYAGVQNIAKRYDLADATKWAEINNAAYAGANRAGGAGNPDDRNPFARNLPGYSTDWQEELFKQGSIQDYNVGVSGGGPNSTFALSGGYFKQTGTIEGPKFERYSARINTGFNRGKLRVGQNLLLTRSNQTRVNGLPFIDVVRMTPVTPVLDPANPGGFGFGSNNTAITFGTNPIALQRLFNSTGTSNRLQGNIYGELDIFSFLRYRLNLATEYHGFHDREKRQYGQWRQNDPLNPSSYAENQGNELFGMAENTLTFDKSFDKHNLTAVAGYSRQRFEQEFTRGASFGYGTGPTYYWALDAGSTNPQATGSSFVWAKESYFGQITYDYDQRYLLTAAYRRDGSSRFDPENRWGNFGAASVGWRISREAFFSDITAISNLKLRASYGALGNDQLLGAYGGSYLYQGFVNPNVNYVFGQGQTIVNGSAQTVLASTGIKWEERRTTNVGFDLGALEDRLTFSADYYISKTRDALINPDLPFTSGNAGSAPFRNLGELENKGFEFQLGYNDNRSAFRYGVNANLSTLTNRVTDLGRSGEKDNFFIGGPNGATRTEVGYELGSFFLNEFDGIYQTGESIPAGLQAGDVRYKDLNNDGVINDSDRTHVGRVFPKFQYGANLNLGFGAFDLVAFFQGVQGNDVFNISRYFLDRLDENGNYRADIQPWTAANPSTTTPRAVITGNSAGNNARFTSTRWLEDGSYLRLKNLQIGFTVPKAYLERVKGISSFRIYATGQNVFTITDYSGYDPETVGSGVPGSAGNNLGRGFDEGSYPNLRTFTLGIQAGF